jgi:Eukaryotic porin
VHRDRLLNDDYIFDKKVQVKTKTQNGMTYTSTAIQSAKDDSLAGDLELKFSPAPGAAVTSKLFTSGKMSHEAVFDRLGVEGLKLTLLGGVSSKSNVGVSTLEYQHKSATCTAAVDAIANVAYVTGTAGTAALTVGVDGQYDTAAKELRECNVALNYSDGKESETTVTTLNKGESAKLAYSHAIRPDFSVASEFFYDRRADAKLVTIGAKYDVDQDTTLKAKITSDGLVSASYIQEIRANTTLVLCQKFDVRNPDKASHKFGLSLVIE